MRITLRPLTTWRRPETKARKNGPYRVDWNRTLHDLEYEIQRLGRADELVLQVDVKESDVSISGTAIKGDKRPATPRVAISFETKKHGTLTYYCDCFLDWRDNVRAIAMGLERLRMVEQTGIAGSGEQYTGFKQLPAGIPLGPPAMTVEEASGVMHDLTGWPSVRGNPMIEKLDYFREAYRAGAKKYHPDVGGDRAQWDQLQAAAAVLEKHFGRAEG